MERIEVFCGDIVLVDFDPVGSEQGKIRPALIVQNDVSNKYSPVTIVAAITSKAYSKEYSTNVELTTPEKYGLEFDSTILLNQIRTIDKSRIIKKLGRVDFAIMVKVDEAIKASLGID